MGHIGKTHAQFVYVGADKRIGGPHGNMVCEHHEISCRKGRVDAAGGVGQKEDFCPHQLHQTHRQYHVRDRISLIVMHPSLHADHRHILDVTEDKFSGMSGHSGNRKPFDLVIVQFGFHTDVIRIVPKPGTQNNRNLRRKMNLFLKTCIALHQFLVYGIHIPYLPVHNSLPACGRRQITASCYTYYKRKSTFIQGEPVTARLTRLLFGVRKGLGQTGRQTAAEGGGGGGEFPVSDIAAGNPYASAAASARSACLPPALNCRHGG